MADQSPSLQVLAMGDAPSAALEQAWQHQGLVFVASPQVQAPALIWGSAYLPMIMAASVLPFAGFVERFADDMAAPSGHFLDVIRQGGLGLHVRTPSAYGLDITQLFLQMLESNYDLGTDLHERVQLALSECISNAVIHGNLGLTSEQRDNLQGLTLHMDQIAARLKSPDVAARRIEVTAVRQDQGLRITVTDQGQGYDVAQRMASTVQSHHTHGRGLQLMQRLCDHVSAQDQGRRMVMIWENSQP